MKYLQFVLFLFAFSATAQIQFKIYSKVENKPLVNIPVYFGDGNGVYSNAQGEVFIPSELVTEQVIIKAIGYEEQVHVSQSIDSSIIYLVENVQQLPEIVLRGNPKTITVKNVKESKRGSVVDLKGQMHGVEYGVFIPFEEANADAFLTEFTLPISNKRPIYEEMSKKRQNKEKHIHIKKTSNEFRFLFEIKFYTMNSDSSFQLIENRITKQMVTNEKTLYNFDFSENPIAFGEKGLMVSFHNLGPCDEYGVLDGAPRFTYKLLKDGTQVKVLSNRYDLPHVIMRDATEKNHYDQYINWHLKAGDKFSKMKFGALGYTTYKKGNVENVFAIGYKLEIRTY